LTYEELFVYIDELQAHLPKCANAVLLKLIAKCIIQGENTIKISTCDLARELNVSRDAIRVAAIALQDVIAVEAGQNVVYRWTLPAHWFSPQRVLFIDRGISTGSGISTDDELPGSNSTRNQAACRPKWTSYQAATRRETRQRAWLPGSNLTRNQAAADELPGSVPGNQAATCLVTLQQTTQNQQLTGSAPDIDRIDRSKGFSSIEVSVIDRIARATTVPVENQKDAAELSELLRGFMDAFGGPHHDKGKPDEVILARSFAVAPLGDLKKLLLNDMRRTKLPSFDSYMYLVSVFAEKIHGIKNLARKIKAIQPVQQSRKNPHREKADPLFTQQLVQQMTAGKTMR
jgi:hypothetical protein